MVNTFSGGRPITALLLWTTIGRSSSLGNTGETGLKSNPLSLNLSSMQILMSRHSFPHWFDPLVQRRRNLHRKSRCADSPKCHHLFRRGGMNGDRVVEIFFGCTHFDCHRESLDHFIRASTNHMTTNHSFVLALHNQFH